MLAKSPYRIGHLAICTQLQQWRSLEKAYQVIKASQSPINCHRRKPFADGKIFCFRHLNGDDGQMGVYHSWYLPLIVDQHCRRPTMDPFGDTYFLIL